VRGTIQVARLYVVGIILLLGGFIFLFIGSAGGGSSSFGGVVFIGPFPIAFGSGPGSGSLVLTSVVIAAVMILMMFVSILMARKGYSDSIGGSSSAKASYRRN
jgi:uncharacterized membrane protein